MDRTITSEQLKLFMLQEQWKVADFLYECGQLRWQNPPAYLVAPVQGDRQVQEADIPKLSADEFESLLVVLISTFILHRKSRRLTWIRLDSFSEYTSGFLVSLGWQDLWMTFPYEPCWLLAVLTAGCLRYTQAM
jgi:hypothetical protein